MPSDPRSERKVGKALDQETPQHGENRGQIVARWELQLSPLDLAAPPRKTAFLHGTNKRHVPFSFRRSDRRPYRRQFADAFELSQKTLWPIASTTQAKVEHHGSCGAAVVPLIGLTVLSPALVQLNINRGFICLNVCSTD
jgi:hypothetical protein